MDRLLWQRIMRETFCGAWLEVWKLYEKESRICSKGEDYLEEAVSLSTLLNCFNFSFKNVTFVMNVKGYFQFGVKEISRSKAYCLLYTLLCFAH